MKKAFVTGANGHIGSNLVRDLVEHGYEVVAFVRPSADLRGLEGVACTIAKGDVTDEDAVASAMAGADVVFHAAAPYQTWAKDPETIVAPAIKGTEAVLRAAKTSGVRRVVVTSSCNAVGFTTDPGKPLDESSWNEHPKSPYIRAKNEQERRARALAKELGVDLVTVLPTTVLGRFDYKKTPTSAPFVDAIVAKGPIPTALNLVDVRDVARAHVLAAEKGEPGERYLAGGENVDVATLASAIEARTGKRPQEGMPPLWLLRVVASVAGIGARLTGKPPILTNELLDDVAGRAGVFDCTKARTKLGLEPRAAGEVLDETIRWALFMGWIPEPLAGKLREAFPPDAAFTPAKNAA